MRTILTFSYRMWDKMLLTLIFTCLLCVCVFRNCDNMQGVIWSDTEGYYMYLPALIIHKDLHHVPERSMDSRKNEKGEVMMKYTCGVAFCYLPFFLGAHTYAMLTGADTSGFSNPYYYGLILCGIVWGLLGMYSLLRLLGRYFSNVVAWLTMLALLLGTNYFYYLTKYMGMSHIYSFTIVVWLILLTDKYYRSPARITAMICGLLMGWLVLIRPTNCIIALFLLLYNTTTISDLKQRIVHFRSRLGDVVLWTACALVAIVPQLLYWKEMTGKWLYYSYDGEGFVYWKNPKILAVLADTQNGLFVYSPVLLLSVAAMFMSPKDKRTQVLGIATTFWLATYMFASWWVWNFGAAYGHRCYIEYFPLFAFPLAVFIEKIRAKGTIHAIVLTPLLMLFVLYSVGLTRINDKNGIWCGDKWRWNWQLWAKMVYQIPDKENLVFAALLPMLVILILDIKNKKVST
jgi:hypothetical protein